jgi:hypothetical protein
MLWINHCWHVTLSQWKCSPVHFFWGAFNLAVTRFSGRPPGSAPPVVHSEKPGCGPDVL